MVVDLVLKQRDAKEVGTSKVKTATTLTPRKVHKKHNFKKACDVCGRVCRGNIGLGIHKAKKHNLD